MVHTADRMITIMYGGLVCLSRLSCLRICSFRRDSFCRVRKTDSKIKEDAGGVIRDLLSMCFAFQFVYDEYRAINAPCGVWHAIWNLRVMIDIIRSNGPAADYHTEWERSDLMYGKISYHPPTPVHSMSLGPQAPFEKPKTKHHWITLGRKKKSVFSFLKYIKCPLSPLPTWWRSYRDVAFIQTTEAPTVLTIISWAAVLQVWNNISFIKLQARAAQVVCLCSSTVIVFC